MGPRAEACAAHVTDDLALSNLCPSLYLSGKSTQVSVVGSEHGTMLNLNKPSVAAFFPARVGYPAIANCSDWRSRLGREVYSVVGALDLEDRMETDMEKGRTDTAKLNGVTEEGAGKRSSFEIVVVIFAVLFLKVNGKVFLPLVDQLCGQNAKRCVFLASLPIFSLIENFEVISRSDVSMKVHIPAKDIHKLGNDCGM